MNLMMSKPLTPVWELSFDERLQYTRIHEAAHAVIGHVLDVPITRIHIGTSPLNPNWLGYISHHSEEVVLTIWENNPYLTHRTMTEVHHAMIFCGMAAAEAEELILGQRTGGDKTDREHIDERFEAIGIHGEDRVRWEARMRRHTRTLVKRHKRMILYVWRYLLSHSIVKTEELAALLRRAMLSAE